MSCVFILFLASSMLFANEAFNLRQKGEAIPDSSCKNGVVSPDLKICCTAECGSCGTHPLCDDPAKYHAATGKLADNCCSGRILKKAASCDKDHAPCVLSDSYKEKLNAYVEQRPKRHASDDCGEAVPKARATHSLAMEKGDALTKIHGAKTKLSSAQGTATKVNKLATAKIDESKAKITEYSAKIETADIFDQLVDPLSGTSQVDVWNGYVNDEKAEIKFYESIVNHSVELNKDADAGLKKVKDEEVDVQQAQSVKKEKVEINTIDGHATKVDKEAKATWQQWVDATKDYSCGAPPNVTNAAWQCLDGNTKHSPTCHVVCKKGYDGKGTKNSLRCRRQGKFGQKMYGEWTGMAACVGRMCGRPPKVENSKTVAQDIRYPHEARYTCHEGHSTDGSPTGAKAFNVPCDTTGNFDHNSTHVCKPISCGSAPVVANAKPVSGTFTYTNVVTFECLPGFTVDETPGGLTNFSVSCQASGEFTKGPSCKRVRCGPPSTFEHTDMKPDTKTDQYFEDKLDYHCRKGYTLDQKPSGATKYTLVCHSDGEFAVEGTSGDAPLPKCQCINAGMSPEIPRGSMVPREMCYGESELVTAATGFSTIEHPQEGLVIKVEVTAEGTYKLTDETSADFFKDEGIDEGAALELAAKKNSKEDPKFKPVVCGVAPKIDRAKTSFTKPKAYYEDVLHYECEDGYSTDKTDATASKSFSIECEADASFSKAPGLGKCVNIDDCDGHTCGPFGACVDHLKNYTCECQKGFEQRLDAETQELMCGNIDDCGPEACGVGKCIDGVEDYKCDCPTGFEQTDSENEDGKVDHTCKAVLCGTPPRVTNGATTPIDDGLEKAHFPKQTNYQCDLGHTIDATPSGKNHFSVECQASKEFTDMKECKPIKCGEKALPKVPKSSTDKSSATYGQKVRFDCDKGHTVDGTVTGDKGFTLTCQVTGKFGNPQQCKPITCGEPDEVPNAHRPSGDLQYAQSVKYKCFDGFTLDGSKDGVTDFSIECNENGTLTKVQQCLPKVCGEPPLQINALYASTKDEGLVRYPMNTEVICRDGYTIGGEPTGKSTFTVACTSSGEFARFDEGNCEPVRCGVPPPMANATLAEIKSPNPPKAGVEASIFYFRMGGRVPKLLGMKPDATQVVTSVNYGSTGRAWPGFSRSDHFAVRFSGQLNIKAAGGYVFELTSDDGSLLYVDGSKVVDNDGLHGMRRRQGTTALVAGPHSMIVDFFERGGGAGCILKYKGRDTGGRMVVVSSKATQTKGANINYEEKATYKCNPGFTTGGEFDAPTTFNVECLPSGQLSAPSDDMQCRNVNDCEFHTCGPKGTCVDLVGPSPAYTCVCEYGYEVLINDKGEKHCGTKDDCIGQDCGAGLCVDQIGGYTCVCPSGYYIGENPLDKSKTCLPVMCPMPSLSLKNGQLLSKGKKHSSGAKGGTGLKEQVFYRINGMRRVPNLNGRKANVDRNVKRIWYRNTGGNWPGFKDRHNYAVRWTGFLVVKSPGRYHFMTVSDDGSRLFINNRMIVNNDGLHGWRGRSGRVNSLSAGKHALKVEFFERGGHHGIDVKHHGYDTGRRWRRLEKDFLSASAEPLTIPFPTTLRYKCDYGYSVDGTVAETKRSFQAQCKADGQIWGLMSCQKVSCGTPHVVPFTKLIAPGKQGLKMSIYYFRMGGRIPNLGGRRPSHTRVARMVNYRSTGRTWPGLRRKDHFAVRFSGQISIKTGGRYHFMLTSDDGSKLYIDGRLVVNNDGLHGMRTRTGVIHNLVGGSHRLMVDFFERGGGAGVILKYHGRDSSNRWRVIPSNVLQSASQKAMSPRKSVDFGEKATYQCTNGYTVGGKPGGKTTFQVKCQDNGVLSDPAVCEPIKCGTAPYVPKARPAIAGTVYYGQSLYYQCDTGYTLDGTIRGKTSFPGKCMKNGKFHLPGIYKHGLKMSIYYFRMGGRIPNLVSKKPAHVRVARTIYYRSTGRTWPGLRSANNFAVRFSGQLSIATGSPYWFQLTSDDGSMLYLDGFRVVNNDGLHGMRTRTGKVRTFAGGAHALTVDFFERGGGAGIYLRYRGRDTRNRWRVVPSHALLSSGQPCKPISAGKAPAIKNAAMQEYAGNPTKPGWKMQIYYFRMGGRVPNLAGRRPSHTRVARLVNYRNTGGTWPGLRRRDHFAVRFSGTMDIKRAGNYLFQLRSDDGSNLYVDGHRIVNNDGLHGWRTRNGWARNLKSGGHAMIVDFFERGGHAGILLLHRGPDTGNRWRHIPTSRVTTGEQPEVFYPNGVEYRCRPGYSSDGTPSGPTKITSRVTVVGTFAPSLPKECKPIKYTIRGMVKNARNGAGLTGVKVMAGPASEGGFKEEAFYFRRTGRRCPNLARRRPNMKRIVKKVWYRATGGHWPGFRQRDHFAVRWTGSLKIRNRGNYWYQLISDDGSKLWVDNRFVVNNDGLHGMRSRVGRRFYHTGQHTLRLEMFEHGGGAGQYFKYRGPDTRMRWWQVNNRVVQAVDSAIPRNLKVSGTTANGFYTLKDVPPGPLKIWYKSNGYITSSRTLHVRRNVNTGGVADNALSPRMRGDEWRAVLKWGSSPADLDTYGRWGWSNTFYGQRRQRSSGITGVLEQDRTTGYGPETLHLSGVGRCRGNWRRCDIRYMIKDDGQTGRMPFNSNAQVTLYTGSKVVGTWKIKDCLNAVSRNRVWWHVFTIDGRRNQLKWSCGPQRTRQFRRTLRFDALNSSASDNSSTPIVILNAENHTGSDNATAPERHWLGQSPLVSSKAQKPASSNKEEVFHYKAPKVGLVDRKLRGHR